MKKTIVLAVLVAAAALGLSLYFAATRSDIRAAAGQVSPPEIVLYTGEGFTGRSVRILGTTYDLPVEEDPDGSLFNWNDRIRSLVVTSGTWRIWQNGRVGTRLDDTAIAAFDVTAKLPADGWSVLVSATSAGPFEVSDLALAGIGTDASSIELVSTENLPDWAFVYRQP